MNNVWYLYTVKYYSAVRKNEFLSFVTMWMDQECIILSEIRHAFHFNVWQNPLQIKKTINFLKKTCRERHILYYFIYMWKLKNKTYEQN